MEMCISLGERLSGLCLRRKRETNIWYLAGKILRSCVTNDELLASYFVGEITFLPV
jgi:hypothetical protein